MDPRLKKIIALAGFLLVIFVAAMVLLGNRFNITKTEPGTDPYPSNLSVLEIYFNQQLDKERMTKAFAANPTDVISASFEGDNSISIEGDRLIITFEKMPATGKHKVELKNIRSVSGSTLSKTLTIKPKVIPYDQMSKRAQELSDQSVSGEVIPDQYPILADLPYDNENYKISGIQIGEAENGVPLRLTITVKHFNPTTNAGPPAQEQLDDYYSKLRKYRTEALNWIRSKGYNPEDYVLYYTEPELREEFPVGRVDAD